MKICTIIGARPQFIKAAVVSRAICEYNKNPANVSNLIGEIIVHTGQHYDYGMSQVFFDQLEIPEPNYHLNVGSGSHAEQTGRMMLKMEGVLAEEKPDWVLVYGDTNSTLAGAITAAKLHIPIAHVEAGLRSFNRKMPEEINRIVADRLSTIHFAPTETAVKNLEKEGIVNGVHHVPDVMEESVYHNLQVAEKTSNILEKLNLDKRGYVFSTVHRAENTDDLGRLKEILSALNAIAQQIPVILALHPRTGKIIDDNDLRNEASLVRMIDPVNYIDALKLENNAKIIMTDSGGMQKEAFWLGIPCVTMRDETEWVEIVEEGWNIVAGADETKIVDAFKLALAHEYPAGKQTSSVNAGMKTIEILFKQSVC